MKREGSGFPMGRVDGLTDEGGKATLLDSAVRNGVLLQRLDPHTMLK